MKKNVSRVFQRINKQYQPYLLGILAILWIMSTFLAFQAIRQPVTLEEKTIENIIEEKQTFNYEAIVQQSILYPMGGKVTPDNIIFKKITDELIIKLDYHMQAEKPVEIQGGSRVVLKIIAEDMWERETELLAFQSISKEGNSSTLLQEELFINLEEIYTFIKNVEEETLIKPNSYLLIIKPEIKGNVFLQNKEMIHIFNSDLEIPFELKGQYIKYVGETNKELLKSKTIEESHIIQQYFNFFGKELSINKARYGFTIVSIILSLLLYVGIVEITMHKKKLPEQYSIDKKYKGKIISITDKASFGSLTGIGMETFKALLQIAQEKEELILKYKDDTKSMIYYYVIGSSAIYYYCIPMGCIMESSDLAYDT